MPRQAWPAVYGCLDPYTALFESLGTSTSYNVAVHERMPVVVVAIEASLTQILDCTDPRVRSRLRVSEQRMRDTDWQAVQDRGEEALTQAIGRLASELRLEALIVPSARLKNRINVVVFPNQLQPKSSLNIFNRSELPDPR
jgi:RES domain-containing protein